MKQRLNCKTNKKKKTTNNEQYSKQKIKNRFEEMTKDEKKSLASRSISALISGQKEKSKSKIQLSSVGKCSFKLRPDGGKM